MIEFRNFTLTLLELRQTRGHFREPIFLTLYKDIKRSVLLLVRVGHRCNWLLTKTIKYSVKFTLIR